MQCSARSKRSGGQCQKQSVIGSHVCSMHGGTVRKGIASPHWKHGRYSKVLSARLGPTYQRSMQDPQLLDMRSELALLDARLYELVEKLKMNEEEGPNGMTEAEEHDVWRSQIIGTIEARRRVAETIGRIDSDNHLPVDRLIALVGVISNTLRDVVVRIADRPVADAILSEVSKVLSELIGESSPQPLLIGPVGGESLVEKHT